MQYVYRCEHCNKCYCHECYNIDEYDIYIECEQCDVLCCDDCRLQRYRQGQQDCTECIKRIAPLRVVELQEENEELKFELEELKREIEELKSRNLE